MHPALSLQDHHRSASDPGFTSPKIVDTTSIRPLTEPSSSSTVDQIELIADFLNDTAFHNLLRVADSITNLRCVGCQNITAKGFQTAPYPNTLEKIVFIQCQLDRSGLFSLLRSCSKLRQLHLDHCTLLQQNDIKEAKRVFKHVSIISGV